MQLLQLVVYYKLMIQINRSLYLDLVQKFLDDKVFLIDLH